MGNWAFYHIPVCLPPWLLLLQFAKSPGNQCLIVPRSELEGSAWTARAAVAVASGGAGGGETDHLAGFKGGGDSDHVQHGLQDGGAPHRFEHESQVGHFYFFPMRDLSVLV